MLSAVLLPLAIKAALTVLLVIAAAVAAEAAGPFWGGLIATLPVSAGPAYVLLALDHDAAFVAESALASFAATAACIAFLVALVRLAPRHRPAAATGAAIAVWLAAALLIRAVPWTAATATLLNAAAFALGFRLTRRIDGVPSDKPRGVPARRWFELPLRGLAVALLVVGVTTASWALGPVATGIAAVFPIVFSSLALMLIPRLGGAAAAATLATGLRGMVGFALALLVLHAAARPLGAAAALAAALAVSLAWSALLLAWRRRTVAAALARGGPGAT